MGIMQGVYELLGMPKVVRCAKRSSRWPALRKAHLEANPHCIFCGDYKKSKEVHHVDPVHYDPSRELDPTNLVTLCTDFCHLHIGHLGNFKLRNLSVVDDCKAHHDRRVVATDEYFAYPFPSPDELGG